MSTFSARKLMNRLVAVAALASLMAAGSTLVRAADDDVPQNVREAIEAVLKDRIKKLADEKDNNGYGYKRGTYSKAFKRVDDSTYLVSFLQDTIEPYQDGTSDQLKTERFELTLKKDASGTWAVSKEDKKAEFVGLYRGVVGGKWFYKFDSLSFEKEGLKVTAGPGYAYGYRFRDKNYGYRIFADDLKFVYTPPDIASNMNYYQALATKLAREHPEDWKFTPEYVDLRCDAGDCDLFTQKVFKGFEQFKPSSSGGAGLSGSGERLAKQFDEDAKDSDKRDKENPFHGFSPPPDPDERWWSFTFHKGGLKKYWFRVSYDNLNAWEVHVSNSHYFAPVFAYYSEDVRDSDIDPRALEERPDRDALDFELEGLKGEVDLGLDDPTAIRGDITYTIHIKRQLQTLPFYIARTRFEGPNAAIKSPKLFINGIQDQDGNELTWSRIGSAGGIIGFPEPIPAGTVMKLRLEFLNYDAIYQLSPTFFGLNRSGWLPFVRFTDQIPDFDLTTRIKTKYTLLGVGQRVSESVSDDGEIRTERWKSPSPVTFPTLIFGDYISDDAGKYKAKKLDGTVIPVRVYVDKGSTAAITDVAGVTSGARGIRGKQLQAIATQASVALNLYRDIYGIDYPFAKLDLVADPLGTFYGQSPASIIYLGFGVFRGEGAVAGGALFSGGAGISKFNKDVVAHETGHQWWGSLINNANGRNYWFVESLAELSSAIYVENVFGEKKYEEKVADWRRNVLEASPISTVQNSYALWGGEDGFRDIQANIYNKGPYAFYIFRKTFGDKKFFQLLKTMAQKFAHKEIVTRDIEDVMQQVVGGNMDWLFDQWIRGVGIPQYAIFWTKRQNEKGQWIVEGTIKQRVVFGKDKTELKGVYYRGVAPLTFVDANGKEYKSPGNILVQGPETPFRVIIGIDPLQVYFNKDNEILAEDELVNQNW